MLLCKHHTQLSQLNMAKYIEPTLFHIIDESNEARAAPRIGHHQKHLWSPELHMVLSHIQHQQVFAHLVESVSSMLAVQG